MASTSCVSKSLLPMKETVPALSYCAYPTPLAKYEEVAENSKVFMFTLEKLHAEMGTKFMIPIIGGRELDLHRLFVEVTSRGGFEKIIKERKWKEVTVVFNFPSTATNASFVLRKYYSSLLFHYEQIYYFKALGWAPPTTSDALQSQSTMPAPVQNMHILQPQFGIQSPAFQQSSSNATELREASSAGSAIIGVIDGKFESGYLVTVTIGSEKLKGVLYQAPQNTTFSASHPSFSANNNNASGPLGVARRRRRKKSEIKRRDPAHPKPNRSGYNFFFAEQHARLKSLHQGKDRDISRVIGDLWNKLNESEKSVYQEKAVKDKERYKAEMEGYREKQKMDHIIRDAVPLQQRFPQPATDMVDAEADSFQTPEESSSGESNQEDGRSMEKDFDMDASHAIGESRFLGSEK
ncbi:PREDICTED: high mobility group B protein 15-like isoform X2 [Lupinus angustifolius]|uniref:high mobility group B protein 15-like isoform X2 n=1 Tax=Lupinus angustifolius TaxID=3871 RepID=UPI00092FC64C|nr:PREDICTED: high mobility group B protein 15-like isoform X2 [Lupinus angustifolius]